MSVLGPCPICKQPLFLDHDCPQFAEELHRVKQEREELVRFIANLEAYLSFSLTPSVENMAAIKADAVKLLKRLEDK
jgi:ElaB/YqjD/DUF883 family membrane-anchored ribosome-binding protein